MLRIGEVSIKFYIFYIILLVSALPTESSAFCIRDQQYYDVEKKQCVPCKSCTYPSIVFATCNGERNTVCRIPSFNGGPYVEVVQERSFKNAHKRHDQNKDTTINSLPNLEKNENGGKSNFRNGNRTSKTKLHRKTKKKKHESKLSGKDQFKENNDDVQLINVKEDVRFNTTVDHNINEEGINMSTSADEHYQLDSYERNFIYSYPGKLIISSVIISVNLLLILVLIVKIIKTCHRSKSKGINYMYSCNQKLPHPSQKPIKCRFTAVLPTKSPEYANVDSYSNSLLSPTCSSTSNSNNWNNSCASGNLSSDGSRERAENSNQINLNREREVPERDPLIPTQEMIESANTIQLYSRIPSPNPFTMDRLLEQRRTVGSSSVENNLYVETWCSSPSPMLPRSQGSSVAPSPALSCIRKPFSGSSSSSPLTTRTFRATPAFTSFHPNRS